MLSKEYITPRTFPTALCVVLTAVSLLGIITSCLKYARARRESPQQATERAHPTKEKISEKKFPYLMFALILLYSLLFQKIGFVWATVIVPPIILYLLNCRKWYMYLTLYAFAATVYVIFTLVLHVPLP